MIDLFLAKHCKECNGVILSLLYLYVKIKFYQFSILLKFRTLTASRCYLHLIGRTWLVRPARCWMIKQLWVSHQLIFMMGILSIYLGDDGCAVSWDLESGSREMIKKYNNCSPLENSLFPWHHSDECVALQFCGSRWDDYGGCQGDRLILLHHKSSAFVGVASY
jgi:hypothetical protein